jgi:hypothetical protein
MPHSAYAAMDYDKVRTEIQQPCYPLCNLQKYAIEKKYYPQENPFYYAEINNPKHNPYYYGDIYNTSTYTNESSYLQSNPTNPYDINYKHDVNYQANTNGNLNQSNTNQDHSNIQYYADNNTNSNNNAGINQQNNQAYYSQSSNNRLSSSGSELYVLIGIILFLTSIIAIYIRKKRRYLKTFFINQRTQ